MYYFSKEERDFLKIILPDTPAYHAMHICDIAKAVNISNKIIEKKFSVYLNENDDSRLLISRLAQAGFIDIIVKSFLIVLTERGKKLKLIGSIDDFEKWEKQNIKKDEFEYKIKKYWWVPIIISIVALLSSIFIPVYIHFTDERDKLQMKEQIKSLEKKK
jgi:hypothetical protein